MTEYNLQKFNSQKMVRSPNSAAPYGCAPTSVIIGKRATGKSWLVRDILWHERDVPIGTVVSPTEHVVEFYGKFIPKPFIHHEYSSTLCENIIKRQQAITKQAGSNTTIDPRHFLVLDDCLYDSATWIRDKYLKRMFMNGRHMKNNLIITLQYPLGIGPELRCNIDYVFLLGTSTMSDKRRLYEHYAGMFPTFEAFCETLDKYTRDYGCLVIDNTVHTINVEDSVFWYRAEPHDDMRIGRDLFWDQDAITAIVEQAVDNNRMLKRKAAGAEIMSDLKKIKTLAETIKEALETLYTMEAPETL